MRIAENTYKRRVEAYHNLLEKQIKAVNQISNLRLLIFIAGAIGSAILYFTHLYIVLAAFIASFIALFVYLVIKHSRLKNSKKMTSILLDINKKSLAGVQGQWTNFEDNGSEFADPDHSYSFDLDIFGEGSLFQMINCATTFKGRQKLKESLSNPLKTSGEIKKRQASIAELSTQLRWRQHFMCEAMMAADKAIDPAPLFEWASSSKELAESLGLIKMVRWLPVITIPAFILFLTASILPWQIPIGLLALQFILLGWKASHFGMIFATANKYKNAVRMYYRLIRFFETKSFQSEYLNTLKSRLISNTGLTACQQINKLNKIIDAIDNRSNAFFFIVNLLTLWDYQFILVLDNWKRTSGTSLEKWFEAIGEVEALCSLSVLRHDHSEWAMPEFAEGSLCYDAQEMGHPLLTITRIPNDLHLNKNASIMLITGSNMSGKSTLLRTAGINLVLAYAGAPVCARTFRSSLMQIRTCMRTTDNLEQNTSSFYAELLRIKEIIKASEKGEKLFFLLDEIFKGTNSFDRHTGAEAVINKLSQSKALGLVSTHDLELGGLEEKNSNVRNYHFREFYNDDKINFDYKLRPGVSTTRNAIYLMQMAGIDL